MGYDDGLRDLLIGHIGDYITANGGNIQPGRLGRQTMKCILPGHNDGSPSFTFYPGTNSFYCFGCSRGGRIFELIGFMEGIADKGEQFRRARELYGGPYSNSAKGWPQNKPYSARKAEGRGNTQPDAPDASKGKIESLEGKDAERARKIAEATAKAREEVQKAKANMEARLPEAESYLKTRGIDYDFALARGVGYLDGWIYFDGGHFYIRRGTRGQEPKVKISTGTEGPGVGVLNPEYLEDPNAGPVFVTEGPFDMLAVEQGGYSAIAVSTSLTGKLLGLIDTGHYKPGPRKILMLALDNDAAGRTASAKLLKGLKERGVNAMEVNISGDSKDPNEALTANGREPFNRVLALACEQGARKAEELDAAAKAANEEADRVAVDEYKANTAMSRLGDFLNRVEANRARKPLETGFKNLDEELGGGLYEGLYILGAVPSLGKTTLALQIADHIAKSRDIIFFSTEMAADSLMARSLSRITFALKSEHALTTRQVLSGQKAEGAAGLKTWRPLNENELSLLRLAQEDYEESAPRLYFIEAGAGEGLRVIGKDKDQKGSVRETIERHLRLIKGEARPVIVIDYLQMLEPYDPRLSDKQNTDKAIRELKKISRDYGLTILAISSFNRGSYNKDAGMDAYKESGAIEYGADILLALQPQGTKQNGETDEGNIEAHKRDEERHIELKILKNRDGATGGLINFTYNAKFNYFEEPEGGMQTDLDTGRRRPYKPRK